MVSSDSGLKENHSRSAACVTHNIGVPTATTPVGPAVPAASRIQRLEIPMTTHHTRGCRSGIYNRISNLRLVHAALCDILFWLALSV